MTDTEAEEGKIPEAASSAPLSPQIQPITLPVATSSSKSQSHPEEREDRTCRSHRCGSTNCPPGSGCLKKNQCPCCDLQVSAATSLASIPRQCPPPLSRSHCLQAVCRLLPGAFTSALRPPPDWLPQGTTGHPSHFDVSPCCLRVPPQQPLAPPGPFTCSIIASLQSDQMACNYLFVLCSPTGL